MCYFYTMQRKYFVSIKKVASVLEVDERTVREWCEEGWCNAEQYGPENNRNGKPKKHRPWRIPTWSLRKNHPHLPPGVWEEIVEDEYKHLDGLKSAQMRLQRRKEGRDPTTGERLLRQKPL